MSKQLKNVILIYGDSSFFPEKLRQIKKHFFPNVTSISSTQWKEVDTPRTRKKSEAESQWINSIDSEVNFSSWNDNEKKFIIIRELIDSETFLGFLFGVFKTIPANNYLVLCDSNNTLDNGKAAFEKLKWIDFKQFCSNNATVVNAGTPISQFSAQDKIKYVVEEFKKKSKKISSNDASLLLEIVGDDKLMVNGEIEKISLAIESEEICKEDIEEMAFPISQDYPVWQFYSSINTGSFSKTMDAAERLMENGFTYDSILVLALKQIRWQIIYSHILLAYGNLNKLSAFSSAKNYKKDIFKMKLLDPRILNSVSVENENAIKSENIPSQPNSRDIVNYINNIAPKHTFSENGNLKQVILNKNMERYISAYNGLFDLRTNSTDLRSSLFSETIRKISITK